MEFLRLFLKFKSKQRKWGMIIAVNFPIQAIGKKKPEKKKQGFKKIQTCSLRVGQGFESRWRPDFVRLFLFNFLNWKIYCSDQSPLSFITTVQIWIISVLYTSRMRPDFEAVHTMRLVPATTESQGQVASSHDATSSCDLLQGLVPSCVPTLMLL